MSDPVANDIADAVLRAGKKHGLNSAQLMHEMAKLLAAMTGTMTKALAERATEEPLTPAMAARLSTLGVAIGEPDCSDPWLYLFRLSDRRYFKFLGSKIEPITSTNDVPFSRWSAAAPECTAAVTIVEAKPNELDVWAAAENSAFRIAHQDDGKGHSCYWVERASKYVFESDLNWWTDAKRPPNFSELGWKPLENSEVAAIISEKARTL